MADIISVTNLVKKYNDFTAVDDISFSVKQGEIFGILGPNGAGKTTTLEIMETLKPLTSGIVLIDNIDVTKKPWDVKRRIGVQLQSTAFYPEVRLTELLDMFAAMYDVKIDPIKALREVELEDKARSYVKQLSGGQQQRFSIASTLINQPKVIFLDEPTTGLDPQARIHLWDMVRKINKSGVTIVLTTHYMDEAEQLCNRLAIMDHGKILKIGTPKTFVKDLLKSGFKKQVKPEPANLEDVFLNLTGRQLREG
jgi:ABC-2 type transport system ATP-binding protein